MPIPDEGRNEMTSTQLYKYYFHLKTQDKKDETPEIRTWLDEVEGIVNEHYPLERAVEDVATLILLGKIEARIEND